MRRSLLGPDTEFVGGDPDQDDPPRIRTTASAATSDFLIPGSISQRAIDEYVRHSFEADPVRVDGQAAFFSRLGTADRSWVTLAGGDHAVHLETPRPTFIHVMVSFLRQPR
ncbi:MAG: hypothetical protein ABIF09_06045 [Gemmatimonadota bacterium]